MDSESDTNWRMCIAVSLFFVVSITIATLFVIYLPLLLFYHTSVL